MNTSPLHRRTQTLSELMCCFYFYGKRWICGYIISPAGATIKQPGGLIELKCMLFCCNVRVCEHLIKSHAQLTFAEASKCGGECETTHTATVLTLFGWRSTHGASRLSHKTGYAHKRGKRQLRAADNRDFVLFCIIWCTANHIMLIINCRPCKRERT